MYFNGALRGEFDQATGAYSSVSDVRLKKDIERLGGTLEKIMRLEPVTYRFAGEDDTASKHYGLVAQDVATVFPVAVRNHRTEEGRPDDTQTVAYSELIPVLAKGIQELRELISAQQVLIEEQQSQIRVLYQRVAH